MVRKRKRTIKKKSAEVINRNRSKWHLTFSKKNAENYAGRRQIYRIPSGAYAIRKPR